MKYIYMLSSITTEDDYEHSAVVGLFDRCRTAMRARLELVSKYRVPRQQLRISRELLDRVEWAEGFTKWDE